MTDLPLSPADLPISPHELLEGELLEGEIQVGEPVPHRPAAYLERVCYGFYGQDSSQPLQAFEMSPVSTFRPEQLFAWAVAGASATITSLEVCGDEQLAQPTPSFVFGPRLGATLIEPALFLISLLDPPFSFGPGRDVFVSRKLARAPFELSYEAMHPLLPTVPLGGRLSVRYEGELLALIITGTQLK